MANDSFLLRPASRSLPPIRAKIFPQDPLVADANPNLGLTEVKLSGEACLGVGPTSSRVAVVDYNADLDQVLEPARFRADGKGFVVGRRSPVNNVKFHQVNVWAVITRTLDLLEGERMFGRRIPWAFEGGRLLVLPHAGYWENAFYDRATGALHFFYFEGHDGQPVYTCLSHDIVTHELGHAVLDGLKPYYNEVSSPATAGFHEYFGDAVAMTMALATREIVVEVAGRGTGDLSERNLIANIAAQFGQALSPEHYGSLADAYLRSGLNDVTMDQLAGVYEEHRYSEVLTGAYYDLLRACYENLFEEEEKRGTEMHGGTRVRLLMRAAALVARLALRALDYCPPVDIDFADYARAVIRSDQIAYPLDPMGYREIATRVFLERKIIATADDLLPEHQVSNNELRNLDVGKIGASATDAYDFVDANREILRVPPEANFKVTNVYRTRKVSADGYRPPQEIIVEFVWSEPVRLRDPRLGELRDAAAQLWCGGTLVFNRDGNLLHYVLKEDTPERRETLSEYVAHLKSQRRISLDDGERGMGARGQGANAVSGTLAGGRLELSRTAAFRHLV